MGTARNGCATEASLLCGDRNGLAFELELEDFAGKGYLLAARR